MQLGGEILGAFLDLVRLVLVATSTAISWFGIVIALVRLGSWLRRSADLAQQSLTLIEALEAEPAI